MSGDHVLISSIRNEGPFLLEWVAHHLALGFDAIYIASNDCDDGSAELLNALQAAGAIVHVPNIVAPGEIPQHTAYARIRASHPIDAAEWLMVLDADEFLNIHVGDHSVRALTTAAGARADIISVCARTFSDQPQRQWSPGLVRELFPLAAPPAFPANGLLKTLTRNPRRFRLIQNHSMTRYTGTTPLMVFHAGDGSLTAPDPAVPLWKQLRHVPVARIGHRLAQINHYAIRTWDSFLLRMARGRGAAPLGAPSGAHHTPDYFARRAGHAVPETSIARYSPRSRLLREGLLAHPAVREAHAACEAAHAAATAAIRARGRPPGF